MIARGTSRLDTDAQTAARRLVGHLRYLQYRPRRLCEQRADRRIFGATTDHAPPAQVRAAVLASGCQEVVLHTFLLAPEAEAVPDYRAWTRQFVAEHEQTCLCWFGVLHQPDQETSCPHVHVGLVLAQANSPRRLQGPLSPDQRKPQPSTASAGLLVPWPQVGRKEAH